MKVREENVDLINFYLKQGHKLTNSGVFIEEKKALQSFQRFPLRKGRNFSTFT